MYPSRYFAPRYFAPRYWPQSQGIVPIVQGGTLKYDANLNQRVQACNKLGQRVSVKTDLGQRIDVEFDIENC